MSVNTRLLALQPPDDFVEDLETLLSVDSSDLLESIIPIVIADDYDPEVDTHFDEISELWLSAGKSSEFRSCLSALQYLYWSYSNDSKDDIVEALEIICKSRDLNGLESVLPSITLLLSKSGVNDADYRRVRKHQNLTIRELASVQTNCELRAVFDEDDRIVTYFPIALVKLRNLATDTHILFEANERQLTKLIEDLNDTLTKLEDIRKTSDKAISITQVTIPDTTDSAD